MSDLILGMLLEVLLEGGSLARLERRKVDGMGLWWFFLEEGVRANACDQVLALGDTGGSFVGGVMDLLLERALFEGVGESA